MSEWVVAHIITKLELGGAQLATLFEVSHGDIAPDRRYLLYGPGGLLDDDAKSLSNVRCVPIARLQRDLHPMTDSLALGELVAALRSIRHQHAPAKLLVHTHSSKAGILGRWAAKLAGADRIVHSIHGFGHAHHGSGFSKSLFRWAERATASITHGFTADSQANLDQGKKERLLGNAPTTVVHCGIDLDTFAWNDETRAQARARLNLAPDQFVVLNLSCLKPQKDPLTYVRVAHETARHVPDAVFLLAGDGDLRPDVQALITELNAPVRLLGWRRDVPDLLAACDVLALTSRWEGLPQSFGQAMAARKPIVATRVDGAPEAIDDGVSGVLCAKQDVHALSDALVTLAKDPALRTRMADAAYARASKFSQEKMLTQLETFYRELGV